MSQGTINVSVENIFPLIKKFLYSDHEIFLRELISNATDATLKLKHLTSIGEAQVAYGKPIIEVKIDKEKKQLHIIDQGIGMTAEEVKKYINEIAFSGAEEFLEKYKDKQGEDTGIIGHFGLGFYSAFMVAHKVEILTKSYKEEPAAHWVCDGSPNYTLEEHDKSERGTEIILHINEEDEEFLEEGKIRELLVKYNKFMPIPIKFGTRTETLPKPEDAKEEDPAPTKEVDNIINNPNPAWTKTPTDLKEDDYKSFYRELYPMQFEEPLFHIHLNVDYPFNLTGILYFPKMASDMNIQKDRIQLYQNFVFLFFAKSFCDLVFFHFDKMLFQLYFLKGHTSFECHWEHRLQSLTWQKEKRVLNMSHHSLCYIDLSRHEACHFDRLLQKLFRAINRS